MIRKRHDGRDHAFFLWRVEEKRKIQKEKGFGELWKKKRK